MKSTYYIVSSALYVRNKHNKAGTGIIIRIITPLKQAGPVYPRPHIRLWEVVSRDNTGRVKQVLAFQGLSRKHSPKRFAHDSDIFIWIAHTTYQQSVRLMVKPSWWARGSYALRKPNNSCTQCPTYLKRIIDTLIKYLPTAMRWIGWLTDEQLWNFFM